MFGRGLPLEISACCRVICHVAEISSCWRRRYLGSLHWHQCRPCRLPLHFYYCHPPEGCAVFISSYFFLSSRTVKINLQRYSVIFGWRHHVWFLGSYLFDFFPCAMWHPGNLRSDIGCDLHGPPHKTRVSSLSFVLAWHHRLSSVTTPWPHTKPKTPLSSHKAQTRYGPCAPTVLNCKAGRNIRSRFWFSFFLFWVELHSCLGRPSALPFIQTCLCRYRTRWTLMNCCLVRKLTKDMVNLSVRDEKSPPPPLNR